MSLDPKAAAVGPHREKGVVVFTYPKVIFIFPTLIVALICGTGMWLIDDRTDDPTKAAVAAGNAGPAVASPPDPAVAPGLTKHQRFDTTQNLLGLLFLVVFGLNLLVMAIDFPRFTIVAMVLFVLFAVFLFLWIGAAFNIDVMQSVRRAFGGIYAVANAAFYFMVSLILAGIFAVLFVTRYLDYWEILPNEILHHHGPLSDLERYPTMNLKFDKEIPDVVEHLFLGAGKIVLHLPNERKSIVLDNVLFINRVEDSLKKLMSRMEVRLTTDQEVAGM